jgi:tol-pal system protein YbgF
MEPRTSIAPPPSDPNLAPPVPIDATGVPVLPTDPNSTSAPLPVNPVSTLPPLSSDEQASYDTAFAALREGRYAESARRFSSFLEQFPNGDLADNATYWLGESYYVTQNYRIALDTFKSLLDRFPQSAKAADAQLKLGYCHYELREWNEAEAALNEVVRRYPDTTVARLAQGRLRALRLEGRTP